MEFPAETPVVPSHIRAAAGFTLVEMMVAITLAAILLGVGIPSFRETIARSRLSDQTYDLVAAISLARSEAITLNQGIFLCRAGSATATACAGSAANWRFWIVVNAAGTVVRRGTIPTYGGVLVVKSPTLTNDQLAFSSDGLVRTNNTLLSGIKQIVVCSTHSASDNQRTINLGAGSQVSTLHASGGC